MKKIAIIFILVLTLVSMSGCATGMARSEAIGQRGRFPMIYPATLINCGMICIFCISGGPFLMGEINNVWVAPVYVLGNTVDLPISIASDTLFLPLDIYCCLPPIEFNNTNKNRKQEELKDEKQGKNKNEK